VENSVEVRTVEVRTVEVRYAGVVVGRAALRELGSDAGADGVFVGIAEPLPVGTLVTLKIGDVVREARVDDVVESSEPTIVGMRVRWGSAASARPAARSAAPPQVPPPAQEVSARADSGPTLGEGGSSAAAESEPTSMAESGPTPSADAGDEGSGALSAPLSLAGPGGDGAQTGGGKRRRKRR
jgi:hypothetical protein